MPTPFVPIGVRLLDRALRTSSGCWEWTGGRHTYGYGKVWVNGRTDLAHRVSYETFVGPIPDGLTIDHLCCNPPCINPEHLEVVTMRENLRRGRSPVGVNARRTHCLHGHAFDERNTWICKEGKRHCRECHRLREQARRAK